MESVCVDPKLLEKHRDINVYDGWWDCTEEAFKEKMEAIGIGVERMYFSGFWSQGDGACFEGRVEDWELFLKSVGYESNPTLIQHAKDAWTFEVKHDGHYYHENCTYFTGSLPMPDGYDNDTFMDEFSPHKDEFRSRAWFALLTDGVHKDFEELFQSTFKDHMRTLYRNLEEDYEYLTSDEAVAEAIIANDLTDEGE